MAGGPKGVLNVVPTPRELVQEVGGVLASHMDVRKISFTGSTKVGKQLLEQAAGTVKRTSMELGGDAAFVVSDKIQQECFVPMARTLRALSLHHLCSQHISRSLQRRLHVGNQDRALSVRTRVRVGTEFFESPYYGGSVNGNMRGV